MDLEQILEAYVEGQNMFGRKSVGYLVKEIINLRSKINRLLWSMETSDIWWECPKCHYYSKEGLVCPHCGHDPS